jgi:hypothetical protein
MSTQTVFPLSNFITVSLVSAPVLPQTPNQSTIALFTKDNIPATWASGQQFAIYTSLSGVASDFGINSNSYAIAESAFAQQPNFLSVSGGYFVIVPRLQSPSLESTQAAILRAQSLVQFFGVLIDEELADSDQSVFQALANFIQSQNLMFFYCSSNPNDVNPGGALDLVRQANDENSRYAYYGLPLLNGAGIQQTQIFAAAYAARILSVNFDAANSTLTMNGKQLNGITQDNTLTNNIISAAQAAGASVYGNFSSYVCLLESGANNWSDQVYNQLWLAMDVQFTGFGTIVGQSTKLPMTDAGVGILKNSVATVMAQAVLNGFLAPGQWPNSSPTFGNQSLFLKNIATFGFYIFASPVATLTQSQLQSREAPPIQIAALSAGAIHKASIIIQVAL